MTKEGAFFSLLTEDNCISFFSLYNQIPNRNILRKDYYYYDFWTMVSMEQSMVARLKCLCVVHDSGKCTWWRLFCASWQSGIREWIYKLMMYHFLFLGPTSYLSPPPIMPSYHESIHQVTALKIELSL